jgi:hypothetical protein
MEKPLSLILETTKGMLFQAFNQVQEQTKLPAYLMEGIVIEILSDIRNQKNLELAAELNKLHEEDEKKEVE